MSVFTETTQLGTKYYNSEWWRESYILGDKYRPYIQSVIDHISSRMEYTDLLSTLSVFDPHNFQRTENELSMW